MSEIIRLIILGIIQGLTEFLPVSSSGHLELAKFIMQDDSLGEESLITTVVLHAATALSTIVVFRKDILNIITGLFDQTDATSRIFAGKIILSMIPAALIGILLEDQIEALFYKRLALVGSALIITGLLLFLAERKGRNNRRTGWWDALIIGIAQAIAILPGISRSGSTIATSVLLGIKREDAARFSFLMVVPLILGKMILDVADGSILNEEINWISLSAGFIAAFFAGLLACTWMIRLVKNSKLHYFAVYCFIVGVITLIVSL